MKRLVLAVLCALAGAATLAAAPRPMRIVWKDKHHLLGIQQPERSLFARAALTPLRIFRRSPFDALPALPQGQGNQSVPGVPYVMLSSAGEMGANANSAYLGLPPSGGILVVPGNPNGCWNFSTPIVFNTVSKYVLLEGASPGASTSLFARSGSCINYVPTTATNAITLDYVPSNGSSYAPAQGIRDLTITNNACSTNGGCGSLATGIAMGVTNGGAQRGYFSNLLIEGFGTGFANANGTSWGQQQINNTYTHNAVGVALTAGPLENMQFTFNYWITNGTAVTNNGADVVFNGGGFDSNTGGTLNVAGYSATSGSTGTFSGFHFENFNCATQNCMHYINSTGQVSIFGGVALDDTSTSSVDYWFTVNNAYIHGLTASTAGQTVTNLVLVNSMADIELQIASANLTPCPAAASVACSLIGTGTATPFLNEPSYRTSTNCAVNTVSPAACGAAASGAFVVPTTTTSYTVNTSAVTAASRILLTPMSFAGNLPSSPTCVVPAVTSGVAVSAISAGTSFSFVLPSTTGQTCWEYWIVD